MKGLLILLLTVFLPASYMPAEPVQVGSQTDGPFIQFDKMVYDFGTFTEGDVVTCVFTFKNTGSEPLVVTDVEKPCGCTTPNWSRQPIMPGKTGQISVTYTSKFRPGFFRKTLVVSTNMAPTVRPPILMIRGNASPDGSKTTKK